ncbi:hypothetical protein RRG08_038208 [Elysia crispata]|uniref:Uncharacterized protein n=1 Tax=Elysia crispata TaxID=231223 RepID=A0AAE1AMU5_9GAST|nr:hypothetical protein RRG08_038208 [Elysia crispata]
MDLKTRSGIILWYRMRATDDIKSHSTSHGPSLGLDPRMPPNHGCHWLDGRPLPGPEVTTQSSPSLSLRLLARPRVFRTHFSQTDGIPGP